jgi:hypothetical protein
MGSERPTLRGGDWHDDPVDVTEQGCGYGQCVIAQGRAAAAGAGSGVGYGDRNAGGYGTSGYGTAFPRRPSGVGHGDGYGVAWGSAAGYGSGRCSDYDTAGYGAVNKDDAREDGHGDGGMYESEVIGDETLFYHTYNDFNAYGGR